MGDARIDGDDQIELTDQRLGIDESRVGRQRDEALGSGARRDLRGRFSLLQRKPGDAGHCEQGCKRGERQGAITIVSVRGAACPTQANPRRGAGLCQHRSRRGTLDLGDRDVGHGRGDALRRGR